MHQPSQQASLDQALRKRQAPQYLCALCCKRGRKRPSCISQGTLHMCLPCTLRHLRRATARKTSTPKQR